MSGLPIRIAVRVTFDDGAEHDYEVRGSDAESAPYGGFWPEGVVTSDVAKRMEYDRGREAKLKSAEVTLAALGAWAERQKAAFGGEEGLIERMAGYLRAVEDVQAILDSRNLPEGAPVVFGEHR